MNQDETIIWYTWQKWLTNCSSVSHRTFVGLSLLDWECHVTVTHHWSEDTVFIPHSDSRKTALFVAWCFCKIQVWQSLKCTETCTFCERLCVGYCIWIVNSGLMVPPSKGYRNLDLKHNLAVTFVCPWTTKSPVAHAFLFMLTVYNQGGRTSMSLPTRRHTNPSVSFY